MSDDPEFEETYEPIEPHMEVLPPEKVIRAGVGMKTVLLLSVLAAVAGAFGGAAIAEAIRIKTGGPSTEIESKIESVSVQNSSLQKDVSEIEKAVKNLSSQKPQDLDALESRLRKLEDRPAAQGDAEIFSDIGARIEALEKRRVPAISEGDMSNDILERLEALEQQQSPVSLNEIADRLDRLEVQSLNSQKTASDASPARVGASAAITASEPIVVLPPLPRAEILQAIADNKDKNQGWLERTMNRHVQVREAGELAPEAILDQIQTHLLNREYREALTAFDTLPSAARSAGKAWRDAIATELEVTP